MQKYVLAIATVHHRPGSRLDLPAFESSSPPQRRAAEQRLRAHKCNRWAHSRRDRVRRRIISVPNRGRSTIHSHISPPVVSGIPRVADAPIPIQVAVHHVRHILGIPWAPRCGPSAWAVPAASPKPAAPRPPATNTVVADRTIRRLRLVDRNLRCTVRSFRCCRPVVADHAKGAADPSEHSWKLRRPASW